MTHGHELKEGNVGGSGCAGRRGVKGGKWDNCNSIINKTHKKIHKVSLGKAELTVLPMMFFFFASKPYLISDLATG